MQEVAADEVYNLGHNHMLPLSFEAQNIPLMFDALGHLAFAWAIPFWG